MSVLLPVDYMRHSCAVHEDFQNAIKVCYNEYSEDIEDKEPFLLGSRKKTSAQA